MTASLRNNREKVLAMITAGLVVSVIAFIVVIEPQLKRHKAHSAHMNQLRLKLTKIRGDLLLKDRIDSVYAQIEPLIAGNGTDQQEMSLFTRELDDLYSSLNVRIKAMKMLASTNEEFYRRLAVKIEMSGRITDIVRFILSVETHPSPVRIEQFEIKAREIVDSVDASFLVTKVVAEQGTEASLDNEEKDTYTGE